jgi:hypothetical protein
VHVRAFAVLTGLDVDHLVGHGDIIGRTPTAAVVIDDPRVSEAHAIVSLRKGVLHLLALRRMLIVDGAATGDVVLAPGLVITLADELAITITAVVTPQAVLGLRLPSGEVQVLPQVASVTTAPPRLHAKLVPGAAATIWSTGDEWKLHRGGRPTAAESGHEFELDGDRYQFVSVPIGQAGAASTEGAGAIAAPLRLVAFYDTVQIYQRNQKVHTVGGTGARILSELVAHKGPTHWEILAREIWPDEPEPLPLRHRWDVALGRLRARLRAAGIRQLLRSDGSGQLALELYDGDQVEDRT